MEGTTSERDIVLCGFQDSDRFKIGEDGRVYFFWEKKDTWVKVFQNGLSLDETLELDNEYDQYQEYLLFLKTNQAPEQETVVGERVTDSNIQLSERHISTVRNSDKKCNGKKHSKQKKMSSTKHPTKPKPKNARHKRLSKLASFLGPPENMTEDSAVMEITHFYDEMELLRRQKEADYWRLCEQEIDHRPGLCAVITLNIPIHSNGREYFDIDTGGVNRSRYSSYNPHWPDMEEIATLETKQKHFFTFWSKEHNTYIWRPINEYWNWKEWFEYEPSLEWLIETYSLNKQSRGWDCWKDNKYESPFSYQTNRSDWYHGIDWELVWVEMYYLLTGKFNTSHTYSDDSNEWFDKRSVQFQKYIESQQPLIKFH